MLADQRRPESERKTFTGRPPKADEKPVPSGLLGPVRVLFVDPSRESGKAP